MGALKLSIAIQSHLSDAAIEIFYNPELAEKRIQFVKTLINLYPNIDINVEEDELNRIYRDKFIRYEIP